MDILKAFQKSGFAGVGATIGESLKKTGALNSLSDATNVAMFSNGMPNPAPMGLSFTQNFLIFSGLTLIGLYAVKRVLK